VHQLLLTDSGQIVLQSPGWRGLVQPVEEYTQTCDVPEIYDCLAPERIDERGGVTTARLPVVASADWSLSAGRRHQLDPAASRPRGKDL
jgi:hypothetical protein